MLQLCRSWAAAACDQYPTAISQQERDSCLLGNLEEVLASRELREALMSLPLGAFEHLLSSMRLHLSAVCTPR